MLPLSPNVARAVDKLFANNDKDEAVRLLTEQCGNNLPNCQDEDEYSLEDLRFQVLRRSNGNIDKLRHAINIANNDWREIIGIGTAGSIRKYKSYLLGDKLEKNSASDAVWHTQLWHVFFAIITFLGILIMELNDFSSAQIESVVLVIVVVYVVVLYLFLKPFRGFKK